MKKYYLVEERDLISMIASQAELQDLENAGVDNWSFYGEHVDLCGFDDYNEYAKSELKNFESVKK